MVTLNGDFSDDDQGDELEAGEQMVRRLRQFIASFLAKALRSGPEQWHHATSHFRLSMAEAALAMSRMEADHYAETSTVEPHEDVAAAAIVRIALLVNELRTMGDVDDDASDSL